MEHESRTPPQTALPKIIGGVVALGLVAAVLYAVYAPGKLSADIDTVNAYNNCKTAIMARMVRPDKTTFLNTPADTKIKPDGDGYSLLMKVRASNGFGHMLTITYRCSIAKAGGDFYKEPGLEEVSRE